jgi:hypothetical protein
MEDHTRAMIAVIWTLLVPFLFIVDGSDSRNALPRPLTNERLRYKSLTHLLQYADPHVDDAMRGMHS